VIAGAQSVNGIRRQKKIGPLFPLPIPISRCYKIRVRAGTALLLTCAREASYRARGKGRYRGKEK